jgi:predicted glycogen debranching enzyme
MIELGPDICSDFGDSSSREWLETNGIGGYSSGTVSGANTRRYHGLLVAATEPPLGRVLLLSKLEDVLVIDGERFELSANQYPGSVHPQGFRYLKSFRLDPFPIWTFRINGLELEKRVVMAHGANTVAVTWQLVYLNVEESISLEVSPLLAFRDHHHLNHVDNDFDTEYTASEGEVSFKPYPQMPTLRMTGNFAVPDRTGSWYRNFQYPVEEERGFDYAEDLYQPCKLTFDLTRAAELVASTESAARPAIEINASEIRRRALLVAQAHGKEAVTRHLILAADQFIVNRGNGKTVIAGYPWFSDWGRDTMIALPGLTLATERPEIAKSIIKDAR